MLPVSTCPKQANANTANRALIRNIMVSSRGTIAPDGMFIRQGRSRSQWGAVNVSTTQSYGAVNGSGPARVLEFGVKLIFRQNKANFPRGCFAAIWQVMDLPHNLIIIGRLRRTGQPFVMCSCKMLKVM